MPFGDRMAMGEGVAVNMSCGHPHVEQYLSPEFLPDVFVTCPLCGQMVHGSLRELPHEETQHEQ